MQFGRSEKDLILGRITTRENLLGDLINELRKANSMKNSWPCYNNMLQIPD